MPRQSSIEISHKDIIDKRERAAVTYIDRKKPDLQSSKTLRMLEKELNVPKTSIVRAVAAISSNKAIGKRGR